MSRSGYSDDIDGWALIRWRGAVAAAIRGHRGQQLLHGLAAALDRLPVKRLITGAIRDERGDVCALGALAPDAGVDPYDYEAVARYFGVSEALAREIMYLNDEYYDSTPEARFARMRRWVHEHIRRD